MYKLRSDSVVFEPTSSTPYATLSRISLRFYDSSAFLLSRFRRLLYTVEIFRTSRDIVLHSIIDLTRIDKKGKKDLFVPTSHAAITNQSSFEEKPRDSINYNETLRTLAESYWFYKDSNCPHVSISTSRFFSIVTKNLSKRG